MSDQAVKLESSTGLGACPMPLADYDKVLLAHGSGGKLTGDLIQSLILPEFRNRFLSPLSDAAVVSAGGARLAFSTDSFVVDPIFFPGGDIGELAVNGTVNDLAMSGAKPLFLSAGFIIEEGFPMDDLRRVVRSMRVAAERAGVLIVAGDTKVVDRGKGDKIFINTSGIGTIAGEMTLGHSEIIPGDSIVVSGTMGDHGTAILCRREGLSFETELRSDTAPLNGLVEVMMNSCKGIRMMRDPTRGGLATVLNELVKGSRYGIRILEDAVPVSREVNSACEILGLDPLYVANEGKLVAVVRRDQAEDMLAAMRGHPFGRNAAVIGSIVQEDPGLVTMKTSLGTSRVVRLLAGEQLPRIC